jgi:ribosomal protein S18 acetylase RimI-like enzyme
MRLVLNDTWIATYTPIMGVELAEQTAKRFSAAEMQRLVFVGWLGSSVSLKATSAGKTVGFAHAKYENKGAIILFALYVLPTYQGIGVSTQLLRAIETHRPSAQSIRLETLRDNASAIRWYRQRGFEEYGSTPNATATTGIASIYMDKALAQSKKHSKTPTPSTRKG